MNKINVKNKINVNKLIKSNVNKKDKCIKIWEAKTLNYIKCVELQSQAISICHIPDFDYLAVGTQDRNGQGSISIYSLINFTQI